MSESIYVTRDGEIPENRTKGRVRHKNQTHLSELQIHKSQAHDGQTLFSGDAVADVDFPAHVLGESGLSLLKGVKSPAGTMLHVRSFLARMGLDADLLQLNCDGKTEAHARVRLRYLTSAQREGKRVFPIHDAIRAELASRAFPLGNLIILGDAKPLTEAEIHDEEEAGGIVLPDGWELESDGVTVRIPLEQGLQFATDAATTLTRGDLAGVMKTGKRGLRAFQEMLLSPSPLLKPGFDVRGTRLRVRRGLSLILDRKTSHTSVRHSSSPWIEADSVSDARHWELQTTESVAPEDVMVRGRIFRTEIAGSKTSVSVPVGLTMGQKAVTLDRCSKEHRMEVGGLLSLIGANPSIGGVLISPEGATVLPTNGSSLWKLVRYTALEGRMPDDHYKDMIRHDLRASIEQHPAVVALGHAVRNPANHYLRHALVSRTLLLPDEMNELAVKAGVGAFFCSELQQHRGNSEAPNAARYSVT
ncbi:hypothetical protein HZA87_01880, partial [Candidatus Uhrbacteria bacterium]|nr:hypothetical protein [Candidatus Uhrbacteria bacterium]